MKSQETGNKQVAIATSKCVPCGCFEARGTRCEKKQSVLNWGDRPTNLVPRVFVPLDQRSENERLWEQPFWDNKGNNQILPIRFHTACIYGAWLKLLLPELSIPATGQKDHGLWGWECRPRHFYICRSLINSSLSTSLFCSSLVYERHLMLFFIRMTIKKVG